MTKKQLKELKKLRDYMASYEWQKLGGFNMGGVWSDSGKCGCLIHYKKHSGARLIGIECNTPMGEFLYACEWEHYDNTVEGAIGRIDAVLDGLRF